MKTVHYLVLLIILKSGNAFYAQTSKARIHAADQQSDVLATDVKAQFVSNQNYLYSASALRDLTRFYGDSLRGFDENAIKLELMARNFYGQEYFTAMNNQKRAFINKKYSIGPAYAPQAPVPSQAGNRPIGGGGNTINVAPCVNEDFELTAPGVYNTANAVTGWTIDSGNNPVLPTGVACQGPVVWAPGSPEFSIVATPILALPVVAGNFSIDNVNIPNSPLGGTNVARLQNSIMGSLATRMRSTFPVTTSNTLFQFAYAGSWDGSGHQCCDQPSFNIRMYDCQGVMLTCATVSLTPSGQACVSGVPGYSVTNNISWTNWKVNYIDLTPFLGTCVTVEVINSDCNGGAHHGSAYFDARCGGALIGSGLTPVAGGTLSGAVSFCAGSNQAQIAAPPGYTSYQWYAPSPGNPPVAISPTLGGNTPMVTIPSPVAGSVYSVQLVTASGCTYTAIDTLKFTSVVVAGVGSNSTCPGGASGSATVQGSGSGTGYNYNWFGPANPTLSLGTASVISGLAAGVYTVGVSGAGAAGCGSAVATVTIGVSAPNTYTVIRPFCGNQAFLSATGSNFQWYNGLTAISPTAGGTASSYIVSPPSNGQAIVLSYITLQGCKDSVTFLLSQTPSGAMFANGISFACPGVANATASILMTPASGAPTGINSFSVFSIAPTPAYSASLFPTSSNSFALSGMPSGTYNAVGFDGACSYSTSFVVNDYVYNFQVSPQTSTLCPGNSILAGVSFSVPITPAQYSYQWSPATWITGGSMNTNNISVQIAPVIPTGSIITTTYSITVTPSVVNCPITQTISVTAVNLQNPVINPIQPFCNNANPQIITATPAGGVFSTGSGAWLSAGGTITPGNILTMGTNTFVYAVSVSTCQVSSVGSFNVAQFNPATLTGSIVNQCSTFPCTNLMGIVASTVSGAWSGLGVNNNTYCPTNQNGLYTLTYNTSSSPYPNLCPDASTISVLVNQPVTPLITPMPAFCTNRAAFTMTANPSGGVWSCAVNPILITPGGIVTPGSASLGQTTVTYTFNNGACPSMASTVLDATLFRSAALTNTLANLCANSAPVNLMGIVQNTVSGVWSVVLPPGSSSAPFSVPGNILTPNMNIPTGTYTLQYNTTSSPNPNVCPDFSRIAVHILSPLTPTVTQPSVHCNVDSPFQVQVTPATGSFVPTPYLTANGIFTPSLSPVGFNAVQYVIGTSTCNASDTKTVSVEGWVDPAIIGSIPDKCNTGGIVNLGGLTQNSSGYWSGPGINGPTFSPALSGAGVITLNYNTSSVPSGLCPATATLAVTVYSLATPLITQVGPICNSQAGQLLSVSPLGGTFGGQNTGAVDANGWLNPQAAIIGDNIVNYSVTSGPCIAYAQTTIKVEKFISADFAKYAGPYCKNDAPIDLNSIVQNPGGVFAGPDVNGSIFTPAKANIGNGNIIVYQTHSMPTASLCPDSSAIRIQVNDIPNVSVVSNNSVGCAPVEVILSTPSTGAGKGEWSLGDGSELEKGLTVSHTYTAPGTYTVLFNYWDEIGCNAQISLKDPITVYAPPTAAFSYGPYNELTISEPDVQFTNLSTVLGKNTYVWKIGNLYELTEVNPQVKFPKIGKYEISLTATTIHGCKDKVTQTIEIKNDFGIYIPNSFTPNDDGLNDTFGPVFSPYGLDAKTFDMEIFDRWGASLYHTKDVSKGWDGTVQNKGSEKLKQEVYVYKIKYKDLDGVIYNKLGHVSLLR